MKLTKREKNLILALLLFAYLSVYFFIFLNPLMTELAQNKEKIEHLDIQKNQMELLIARKPMVETALKEDKASAQAALDNYFKSSKTADIDSMITSLLMESNIHPKALSLDTNSAALTKDRQNYLSEATVNLTISATHDSLLNLLDQIKKTKYIRLEHVILNNASGSDQLDKQLNLLVISQKDSKYAKRPIEDLLSEYQKEKTGGAEASPEATTN